MYQHLHCAFFGFLARTERLSFRRCWPVGRRTCCIVLSKRPAGFVGSAGSFPACQHLDCRTGLCLASCSHGCTCRPFCLILAAVLPVLKAVLVHAAVRGARQTRLQASVEEALFVILRSINEYKDHIPPVTSSRALTFPFDISIAGYACNMGGICGQAVQCIKLSLVMCLC